MRACATDRVSQAAWPAQTECGRLPAHRSLDATERMLADAHSTTSVTTAPTTNDNDMTSEAAETTSDLRPSADGSAVRTSLVAGGG